jgi:ankyrin repeat protein
MLVSFGADLNARNDEGSTAIIMATWYGHERIIQLLVSNGADVLVADQDPETGEKRTAMEYAREQDRTDIANILQQAQANQQRQQPNDHENQNSLQPKLRSRL